MKKVLIGIIIIVVVGLLYIGVAYNRFVRVNAAVDGQWAQVETQYQRRFDLIPNLVSTVTGITKQEQTVFKDIADARTRYAGARSVDDKVGAANQVESALGRLLVITENYPALRSAESFQTLMAQLEGTENRISVERSRFNDAVQSLNVMVKGFPSRIVASWFGFGERNYFEATKESTTPPKVQF